MAEQFADYKAAITANDHAAAAAVADPEAVEAPAEKPSSTQGENEIEKELRERNENAAKPEAKLKRDWRDPAKVPAAVQKRFDKMTAETYAERQRADAAEARLRELESGQQQRPPENGNGTQKRESAQELAARLEREKAGIDSASPKQHTSWEHPEVQQRLSEGRQRYPDFDDVVQRGIKDGIKIPDDALAAAQKLNNIVDVTYELARNPGWAAEMNTRPEQAVAILQDVSRYRHLVRATDTALQEQENAEQVYKHLQAHPDICDKISQMTPAKAYKEIFRLAAQLEAGGRQKPTSKAPEPITPVGTSSGALNSLPLSEFSDFQEYKKARNAGHGR